MTIGEILVELDNHGFADIAANAKLSAINDVVWDICSREPWPFLEKSISLTFNGSSGIPTNYPTDVASVLGMTSSVSGATLYPIRLEEFRARHATNLTTVGVPYFYYFIAGALSVFPVPASSEVILMSYIYYPAELTVASQETDIALPPRFHSIIVDGTLAELFCTADLAAQANKYESKFERRFATMRNQLWQRQLDKSDSIEISDYEDLYS